MKFYDAGAGDGACLQKGSLHSSAGNCHLCNLPHVLTQGRHNKSGLPVREPIRLETINKVIYDDPNELSVFDLLVKMLGKTLRPPSIM